MEVNGREDHRYEASSEWFVNYLNRQGDWLEKTRGNLMVAATVIAGMSFQVMVNPPGGVWEGDNCSSENQTGSVCKSKAGTAVLEYESSKRVFYLGMVISSTVSFSASMSLILLVISGLRLRSRVTMAILVIFMVAAFFFAIALVQSDDQIIRYILLIYFGFWIVFPALIIVIQLVRLLIWLICCCFPQRRKPPPRSLPQLAPSAAR